MDRSGPNCLKAQTDVSPSMQAQRVCSIALGIPTVGLGDGATSMLEFYTLLATIPR